MAAEKKKMNRSLLLLLIAIAIFSTVLWFGAMRLFTSARTTVYVFGDDYGEGTLITGDMFSKIDVDTSTYNLLSGTGNAYARAEEINAAIEAGDRLSVNVVKDLPVTANLFMKNGGTGVESRLADGKVACEILASKVYGLSGEEVRVGSRINLTAYSNIDSLERSELIYQDMMILDIVRNENGAISSVYVECDPKDLVMLQHALLADSVSVSILKPGAYEKLSGSGLKYERNTRAEDDPEETGKTTPKVDYWEGYLGR